MAADAELVRFAFDLLVKATALLAATLFTIRGLRRSSAALRHRVAALGLAAGLALPVLILLLPAVELPTLPRIHPLSSGDRSAGDSLRNDSEVPVRPELSPLTPPGPDLWASSPGGEAAPRDVAARREAAGGHRLPWPLLFLAAWAGGTALSLGRTFARGASHRAFARTAEPLTDPETYRFVLRVSSELPLRRPVEVLASERVSYPTARGILFPVLLLPLAARRWSHERLRIALLHELAHVKRGDLAMRILAELAAALYWFHPLVHAVVRALDREGEAASDDLVLAAGTKPPVYAGHLLGIARALAAAGSPLPPGATPHCAPLDRRLEAILEPAHPRSSAVPAGAGRLALLAFAATATLLAVVAPGFRESGVDPAPPLVAVRAAGGVSATAAIPAAVETAATRTGGSPRSHAPSCPREPDGGSLRSAERRTARPRSPSPRPSSDAPEAQASWFPPADPGPRAPADSTASAEAAQPTFSRFVHLSRHAADDDDATDWFGRGMELHRRGRYCEAIAAFRRSIALGRREDASSYNVACGYARMGEKDRAFEWLERAREEGFALSGYLRRDEDLDSLRCDPRFEKVVRSAQSGDGG